MVQLASMVSAALIASCALAIPIDFGHGHNHKRNLVFVTKYVHLLVDSNGNTVSTIQGDTTITEADSVTSLSTSSTATTTSTEHSSSAKATTQAAKALMKAISSGNSATSVETASKSSAISSSVASITTSTIVSSETDSVSSTSEVTSTKDLTTSTAAASSQSSSSSSSSSDGDTYSGDGTYYNPGLGSCGFDNDDNDYIVAISHGLFDSEATPNPNDNPFCGKKIKATHDGKSVTVKVVDRCTGCDYYDLDFSPAAFDQLADEAEGRITIEWSWV